jgi:hypothetical protein
MNVNAREVDPHDTECVQLQATVEEVRGLIHYGVLHCTLL